MATLRKIKSRKNCKILKNDEKKSRRAKLDFDPKLDLTIRQQDEQDGRVQPDDHGRRERSVGSPDAAARLQQPGHVPVAAQDGAVAAEVKRLELAAAGHRGQHPSGGENNFIAKCSIETSWLNV